ncbi:MAG: hypothetical protein HKN50_08780 [Gammaproteobacteria bacterium]|nr:hypothetical protein [Gammaproteobacteria bacterium]
MVDYKNETVKKSEFEFSQDFENRLRDLFGDRVSGYADFIKELEYAVNRFNLATQQQTPTPAEQNAQLAKIGIASKALAKQLQELNWQTANRIIAELPSDTDQEFLEDFTDSLSRLALASSKAKAPTKRGTKGLVTDLPFFVYDALKNYCSPVPKLSKGETSIFVRCLELITAEIAESDEIGKKGFVASRALKDCSAESMAKAYINAIQTSDKQD